MNQEASLYKIKAIIFDFGDVMCFWDTTVMSAERSQSLGLPDDTIQNIIFEYLREGGEGRYHSMLDFFDRAHPKTPLAREVADQLFTEWENSAYIDQEMIDLIRQLKQNYKIGLLSNFPKGLEEYLIGRFHIHDLFDSVVSSYNIQMRKPKLDVYHYSANDLKVTPDGCVFVDDIEKNVRAAEQVGMKGIVFTRVGALRQEIKQVLDMYG